MTELEELEDLLKMYNWDLYTSLSEENPNRITIEYYRDMVNKTKDEIKALKNEDC